MREYRGKEEGGTIGGVEIEGKGGVVGGGCRVRVYSGSATGQIYIILKLITAAI